MKFQVPRGTKDITPDISYRWQAIEKMFHDLCHLYGYHEIRTPIFEDTELFTRTSGETSDIVSKEMYTFNDKGGRSLTLKPEGTASVVRSYLENSMGQAGIPTRLWYATPFFRYDRPQKGRYRQAHQFGLELIGSQSPTADAEIIEMTVELYKKIGIKDLSVLINSIGQPSDRKKYSQALLDHAKSYICEQALELQEKIKKNPLRLLDSKDPKVQEIMNSAPVIHDFLAEDSRIHFECLKGLLEEAGISYKIDPYIVRGLDYYTDTVFEIKTGALGAQNSLCGGGRYDGLVKQLGGAQTPAVGVGIGIERALLSHPEIIDGIDMPTIDVYVISACDEATKKIRDLCRKLRAIGVSACHDLDAKGLKAQVKQADRHSAKYAIFIGEDELRTGSLTLKNMKEGTQDTILESNIEKWANKLQTE